MTAKEHRAKAAASRRFLSQWGSGLNARLHDLFADIIDKGHRWEFVGLFDGDRRVKAKVIATKFEHHRSHCWLLHDDEKDLIKRRGKKFLPCGKNSRILKGLGLVESLELAPAWAAISGSGTGLSGATSCQPRAFRDGCEWGSDAERIND